MRNHTNDSQSRQEGCNVSQSKLSVGGVYVLTVPALRGGSYATAWRNAPTPNWCSCRVPAVRRLQVEI